MIVGNGDVNDRSHGSKLADKYSLDGIMIGRGVFHNPLAFEKEPKEHTKEELLDLLNFHLDLFDQHQPRKFDPLKRFFKIYIRDFPGASELRAMLMEARSVEEVRSILHKVS